MSHHLTLLVYVAIIANIYVADVFLRYKNKTNFLGLPNGSVMLVLSSLIAPAYYVLYAAEGLKNVLTLSDVISVVSYQVVFFSALLYVLLRPLPRRLPNLWLLPLVLVSGIIIVNQLIPFLPGAPPITAPS